MEIPINTKEKAQPTLSGLLWEENLPLGRTIDHQKDDTVATGKHRNERTGAGGNTVGKGGMVA